MDAEIRPTVDKKTAGEYFFRIGLALVLLRALTVGLQLGIQYLILGIDPALYERLINGPWFGLVLSVVPLYAVAFPVFLLALPKKKEKYRMGKTSFGNVIGAIVACFPFMYMGNYIGMMVNEIISNAGGNEAVNNLNEVLNNSPIWLVTLCVVIIAPIGEEIIFRKLLVDRVAPFGELHAILFSGLTFGLFHGNFNQFFYATAIGVLFAYVYVKTKNIFYSIIMHAIVNFVGSVLPLLAFGNGRLQKLLDLVELIEQDPEAALEAITPELVESLLPIYALLAFIGLILFAGMICLLTIGIISITTRAKKAKFEPAKLLVEGGNGMAVWSNPAIITAVAVMLACFILNYI